MILLQHAVLTRHLRGGRIEDACGDVTGHPFVKLQALILDGLFRWMVVSFWAVSVPSWGQIWHSVGVIWAPVGPMKALTWHGWLVVTFWAAGCPKKALKTGCAPTPFLHIFPMVFDDFRRFLVDHGLAGKEPRRTSLKTENTHISNGF